MVNRPQPCLARVSATGEPPYAPSIATKPRTFRERSAGSALASRPKASEASETPFEWPTKTIGRSVSRIIFSMIAELYAVPCPVLIGANSTLAPRRVSAFFARDM